MGQYRYLGYLNQQGVYKAFVGKGNDIYIIRKGDKLDGKFLVASIDPTSVKLTEPITTSKPRCPVRLSGSAFLFDLPLLFHRDRSDFCALT